MRIAIEGLKWIACVGVPVGFLIGCAVMTWRDHHSSEGPLS